MFLVSTVVSRCFRGEQPSSGGKELLEAHQITWLQIFASKGYKDRDSMEFSSVNVAHFAVSVANMRRRGGAWYDFRRARGGMDRKRDAIASNPTVSRSP